eukprot:jgi/Orpsp1_1/1181101/evm.model.c7180000075846.1
MKIRFSSILSTALLLCAGIKADLTESEKKTLLNLHNEARAVLNAPDMKTLTWDNNLANASQEYSNKCLGMVHSGAGPENLAANTSGSIVKMFNQWMSEKEAFDQSGYRANFKSGSYNGSVVGHYSQIVWASNSKVGCGLTYCENYKYKYLLVCRYETGNILKRQVYAEPVATTVQKATTTTAAKKTTTTAAKKTTTTAAKKTTTTAAKKTTTTAAKKTTTTAAKKTTTTAVKKTTTTPKKTTTTPKKTTTTPKKTTTTKKQTTTTSASTSGKCGKNYGSCPSGECCSQYGYCGTSYDYCARSKGCQDSYGKCKNIKIVTVVKYN